MDVIVRLKRKLSTKKFMLLNCGVEKTLESPLDCEEIQPVHSEGDQPWYFFGRMMLNLKLQYLATSCEELTHWKRLWCWEGLGAGGEGDDREEKGTTEDEVAGWHHWLDGHESEWTPEVGDGQGGLACCDSWGCKESDTTERLNWLLNWWCGSVCYLMSILFFTMHLSIRIRKSKNY